ncbi:uncharacterized protein LOC144554394 isoform X2 [Carex rostrata]
MLYFHPSYPYLLALNLSKSYFRVSFMVDSRSIHRIVAIVMPPAMGGDEHEDAHTHDLVMPGFRFHPTEEELIEFYLRRKVEGKHFNIELIASLDLYRYDPWELPAAIGEKELFFYVPRDRKYRSGDRPNRVTPSGYWKATGADRMVRIENNRSIGLKKTLVFYSGKAPKGIRTSWIMNEYRLPHSETEKYDKQVEISLCRVYKRSGIDDHRQINITPTTKASTSRVTADKKPIVKATQGATSQPFLEKSNPKIQQLHGNKTNNLSGGLFCPSASVASLSSTTSTDEDGNTSSIVPSHTLLNMMPLDELSRVIGYNQTSYANQLSNQFVPMVPQSQVFPLNTPPPPGTLSSISDKLWDWNDYTGFK